MKRNKTNVTIKNIVAIIGEDSLKKLNERILITPKTKAANPIVLNPSWCIVIKFKNANIGDNFNALYHLLPPSFLQHQFHILTIPAIFF